MTKRIILLIIASIAISCVFAQNNHSGKAVDGTADVDDVFEEPQIHHQTNLEGLAWLEGEWEGTLTYQDYYKQLSDEYSDMSSWFDVEEAANDGVLESEFKTIENQIGKPISAKLIITNEHIQYIIPTIKSDINQRHTYIVADIGEITDEDAAPNCKFDPFKFGHIIVDGGPTFRFYEKTFFYVGGTCAVIAKVTDDHLIEYSIELPEELRYWTYGNSFTIRLHKVK